MLRAWNTPGLASVGAFLGIGLATVHHLHHVILDNLPEQSAVVHIFGELFAAMIVGAMVLAAISEVRNRLVRPEG
ncbi:hypothetical protein HPT29_015690 [Microvirga terrae]|uniref:Uncharacterized protein n=1 Tax=Microvirga terrae TaxID=2740529 RepID=A0ABY5RL55_9HYPH|nr:hypothetical protein [Microvirga terrae]UVF17958.1 hypothetical protein HPT29_015690 [Microvirga terrae]